MGMDLLYYQLSSLLRNSGYHALTIFLLVGI